MGDEATSGSVEIGPLFAELIPSFHRALDIVAREQLYLTFLEAPPLDQTRAFIIDGAARGDLRLVATAGREVVGWCDILRQVLPAKAHSGALGMGVLPPFRVRGVGLRLITALLERAWAANLTRVELGVRTDNARAIALYERVGFKREGLARDAVRVDGAYRDVLTMAVLRR